MMMLRMMMVRMIWCERIMDIGASSSSGRQAATQRIQLSDISSTPEYISWIINNLTMK